MSILNHTNSSPNSRRKQTIVRFLVFLLTTSLAVSQGMTGVGLNMTYWTLIDGNTFRNYENVADVIYQPNISLFYDHAGENGNVRLFYEGSAFLFDTFPIRQYHSHNLGITGNQLMGDGTPVIAWGIQGGRRFNREEYRYYDYTHIQGYLNLRFDKGSKSIWVIGTQARLQDYQELPEFSYWETNGFIQGTIFLKTRTTIIGRVQAGYKKFVEPIVNEDVIIDNVSGDKRGRGPGHGQGSIPGESESNTSQTVQLESLRDHVVQLMGSLRLAQSLGSRTGVAVEGIMTRNPIGGSRVISGQDSGYEENDDLFDDPYSYESDEILLELTHMLPWNSRIRIGAEAAIKRYDRPVYDEEGNPLEGILRRDDRKLLWVSLQKIFPMKRTVKSLIFTFNYTVLDNSSNDTYYGYENTIGSLGCSITF